MSYHLLLGKRVTSYSQTAFEDIMVEIGTQAAIVTAPVVKKKQWATTTGPHHQLVREEKKKKVSTSTKKLQDGVGKFRQEADIPGP